MDSLVLSVNVTLPLFIMMALGYLLKVLKVVDSELIKKINKLTYQKEFRNSMYYEEVPYCFDDNIYIF